MPGTPAGSRVAFRSSSKQLQRDDGESRDSVLAPAPAPASQPALSPDKRMHRSMTNLWNAATGGDDVLQRRSVEELRGPKESTPTRPSLGSVSTPSLKDMRNISHSIASKTISIATAGSVALEAHRFRMKLLKEYQGDPCTINPRRAKWMPAWDITMFFATMFTAVVTPYEVGFIEDAHCIEGLFLINRVVDFCFVMDMLLIFHLQYLDEASGLWITNRRQIACRYLLGWFWVDVVSVVPVYLIPIVNSNATCYPFADRPDVGSGVNDDGGGLSRAAQGVRTIRLLRLLKLARMFKAARVFNRLITDAVVTYFEITYAVLEMLKLLFLILFIAHLQACMWGFLPGLFIIDEEATNTWKHALRTDKGERFQSSTEMYIATLYWSIMTLTGIGYGDITPQNSSEQCVACVLMLVSASAWAYVIGTIAGIYSTLNPNLVQYRNTSTLPTDSAAGADSKTAAAASQLQKNTHVSRYRSHSLLLRCLSGSGYAQLLYARAAPTERDAHDAAGILQQRPPRARGHR